MKKVVMVALVAMGFMVGCCVPEKQGSDLPSTEMIVRNGDSVDVVVWMTLGGGLDSSVWLQNVGGVFGIKDSGLVGSFVLKVGESRRFICDKAIQGQFCFGGQAYQCLADSEYTGSTLMEFCLNNYGTVDNAQETLDISCVAGVSFIGEMKMCGGGIWTANSAGYDTVSMIRNGVFGENSGRVGVYPVGCDDCTASVLPPSCVKGKGEKPQVYAICQVQRGAGSSGGCVEFVYIGKPYNICK
jgi:hypothetical protein